jgi:hypothetical protein
MKPVIIRIVVDFPAPLGPRNPNTSPLPTEMEILLTAKIGPNCFVSLLSEIFSVIYQLPSFFIYRLNN